MLACKDGKIHNRKSKIPNEQREIVKSEDRQDYGQKNETKEHTTLNHKSISASFVSSVENCFSNQMSAKLIF